jgi:acyl dehydratase
VSPAEEGAGAARGEFASVAAVLDAVGESLGTTEWVTIDQDRIDLFAAATGDRHWVHLDRERAEPLFGGTIAHGFLTLALIGDFAPQVLRLRAATHVLNYGLERVRFPSPVPSGGRVRAEAELVAAEAVRGGVRAVVRYVIRREDAVKPVCVADHINVHYVAETHC